MKHSIDELMLQRCVDGELTDHERAELIAQLHEQGSAETWKTLALSFVEHQVFSKVFADEAGDGEILSFQLARPGDFEKQSDASSGRPIGPRSWLHRRVRPWVTVAASLCLGLIAGVAGHYMLDTSDEAPPQQEDLIATTQSGETPSSEDASLPTSAHAPIMNVNLRGPGSSEARSVSVPVYSPEQWQSLQPMVMPLSSIPEDVRRLLEARGLVLERERHWFRAPLEDGREILVPAETVRVRHAVQ